MQAALRTLFSQTGCRKNSERKTGLQVRDAETTRLLARRARAAATASRLTNSCSPTLTLHPKHVIASTKVAVRKQLHRAVCDRDNSENDIGLRDRHELSEIRPIPYECELAAIGRPGGIRTSHDIEVVDPPT